MTAVTRKSPFSARADSPGPRTRRGGRPGGFRAGRRGGAGADQDTVQAAPFRVKAVGEVVAEPVPWKPKFVEPPAGMFPL